MCSPALLFAGAGFLGVAGQLQAGKGAEQLGQFNQSSLNLQADARIEAGKVEEQTHRFSVANLKGQQKTGFAASGVDVASGSPVDILSDTAALGELDAQTIRFNAETDAQNLRIRGIGANLQGQQDKRQSRANAAGTVLTTAGSIAAL